MNPDTMKLPVAVQQTVDATALVENNHRTPTTLWPQLEDPPRVEIARAALAVVAVTAMAEAATAGAHHMALEEELVAVAIAEAEAIANSHVTGNSRGGYDARHRIEEIRRKKAYEANASDGFPAYFAQLRDLLLPEKFKPLGIIKYDARQDPLQWLRCYALSIENAGGNNDTKCLYFPFCLDQAPLNWLESLDKNSIDE
jgi:hypothetical protein